MKRVNFPIVAAFISLVVAIVSYLSYQTVRERIQENLIAKAKMEIRHSAQDIESWLRVRKTEVKTLAATPTLRTMEWGQVGPFLKPEVDRLEAFYFFALISPDGSYYNTKVDFATGKNLSDRRHVKEALKGNTYASDPVVSRTLGTDIVAVTSPIYHDATHSEPPIGVLAGLIDIAEVVDVVLNLKHGPASYAFALNSKGMPIVHPNPKHMGTTTKKVKTFLSNEDANLATIAEQMVTGKPGWSKTVLDGENVYVAHMPVTEVDWSLALVLPTQNIDAELRFLDFIAAMFGITIFGMVLLLWKVRNTEKAQLELSRQRADAENKAKSDFLATMSHELRTPLNGILGYSQVIMRDPDTTVRQKADCSVIQQCGEHLLAMINDVLELAKIEARKLKLEPAPIHLSNFLEGVADITYLKAEEKGLQFVYDQSFQLPQIITADEQRLRQVLLNLLTNAIKFTDKGTIIFKVHPVLAASDDAESTAISTGSLDKTHTLRFEVRDTGIGMTSEQLMSIFRPFEQVGDNEKKKQGTGLGLAISSQIVDMMKSNIQVESSVDKGSTFWFDLTVHPAEEAYMKHAPDHTIINGFVGEPKRILVVDDNADNRSLITRLLAPIGFDVEEAANGKEGLQRAQTTPPDCIITDLVMPVLDGFELITQARQSKELKDTLIIASSASVFAVDQNRSIAAGAQAFLPKPIELEKLTNVLAAYLPVTWTFASPTNSASSQQGLAANEDIKAPDNELLDELISMTSDGLFLDIETRLNALEQARPDLAPFVNQQRVFTSTFDEKTLHDSLNEHRWPAQKKTPV
jgi:signal transduction histidine kinase/FixJ family two-component response regulator